MRHHIFHRFIATSIAWCCTLHSRERDSALSGKLSAAARRAPPASDRDWRPGTGARFSGTAERRRSHQIGAPSGALNRSSVIPFILSFLIIIGLRAVFEIPAELPSNWIFRLMLDPDHQECESLARIVILLAVVPWVLLGLFPLYLRISGLSIALMHTLVVLGWSLLLTNVTCLIRFRKVPFTCTRPIFQQHSIVVSISVGMGFLLYAASLPGVRIMGPDAAARSLHVAGRLPYWYVPYHLDKTAIEEERRLMFEDISSNTFELIQLGESERESRR